MEVQKQEMRRGKAVLTMELLKGEWIKKRRILPN
jgi:hypothetical protein